MSDSVQSLLTRFFPSNLRPWFEDGAFGWDSICLGFDKDLESTVSEWDHDGFDHFPIWLNFELHAVLAHNLKCGHLHLSIHPTRASLEGELALLLHCGKKTAA